MKPADALVIFLASGLGGLCRAAIALAWNTPHGSWPYGTLAVNWLGALCVGALIGGGFATDSSTYRYVAVGFLGGFTTFSAFAGESLRMSSDHPLQAGVYVALTVIGGLVLAAIGHMIGRAFTGR